MSHAASPSMLSSETTRYTNVNAPLEKSHTVLGIRNDPSPFSSSWNLHEDAHRPRRRADVVNKFWLWEIISCIFSLACIAAIVGVLLYENGRQLSDWRLKIAPNALVSFIATLSKSAFLVAVTEIISQLKWLHFHGHDRTLSDLKLFDEASRGPLGALKLGVFKHKNTLLATWAATIMLASLFVDPALQLVFKFPERLTVLPHSQPRLLSTSLYDPTGYAPNVINQGHGLLTGEGQDTPVELQAAITNGFSSAPEYSVHCPNERCDWDAITTLGFCGNCEDMTSKIAPNCSQVSYTSPNGTVGMIDQVMCFYDFGPLTINTTISIDPDFVQYTAWRSTASQQFEQFHVSDKASSRADVAVFAAVKQARNDGPTIPPAQAMYCGVSVCAKTYQNVSVSNGTVVMPRPIETPLNTTAGLDFSLNYTEICQNDQCNKMNNESGYMKFIPGQAGHPPMDPFFALNENDFMNLAAFFAELFSVRWDQEEGSGQGYKEPPPVFTNPLADSTPAMAEFLAKSPDLNRTMWNLTESMTEIVRTGSYSTSTAGRGLDRRTYIEIQWGWLALPITLMIMTCILLIIVVVQSHVKGTVVWKSSSLALLFHSIGGWEVPEYSVTDRRNLEEMSEQMCGQLRDDLGHPAFVRATGSNSFPGAAPHRRLQSIVEGSRFSR